MCCQLLINKQYLNILIPYDAAIILQVVRRNSNETILHPLNRLLLILGKIELWDILQYLFNCKLESILFWNLDSFEEFLSKGNEGIFLENDFWNPQPPPPINFVHGSHKYHIDIIGEVA